MKRQNAVDFERVARAVEEGGLFRDRNLSVDSLAAQLHTNRTAIYEAISSAGTNFSQFVGTIRARYALDLLRQKDLRNIKVADIAEMSGFSNSRHMNSYIRKIVGVNAHDFRLRVFGG